MANDFSKIAIQLQKHKTVQGIMKYVNQEALIEQHKKQEKNKATGIDNVSKMDYEENLKKNTAELMHSGTRPKSTKNYKISILIEIFCNLNTSLNV